VSTTIEEAKLLALAEHQLHANPTFLVLRCCYLVRDKNVLLQSVTEVSLYALARTVDAAIWFVSRTRPTPSGGDGGARARAGKGHLVFGQEEG
jgi:hypothetical protein